MSAISCGRNATERRLQYGYHESCDYIGIIDSGHLLSRLRAGVCMMCADAESCMLSIVKQDEYLESSSGEVLSR